MYQQGISDLKIIFQRLTKNNVKMYYRLRKLKTLVAQKTNNIKVILKFTRFLYHENNLFIVHL